MKSICQDIPALMEAFETLEVCILLWVASGGIDGVAAGTTTFHYNSDKERTAVSNNVDHSDLNLLPKCCITTRRRRLITTWYLELNNDHIDT